MEERIQEIEAKSQERIQAVERSVEEEKESLVQELSKAKSAAISCLQVRNCLKPTEGSCQQVFTCKKQGLVYEFSTTMSFRED